MWQGLFPERADVLYLNSVQKNQNSKIRRYISMLQKKQKEWALDQAIEITKECVRGGSGSPPDYLLSNAYRSILGIIVEINKSED